MNMKPILNYEQIKELKVDEPLIECYAGVVNYYRFLCFHPRNTNYVILLNHCEEPVRFYYHNIIDRFYKDYSQRDIITYRKDYCQRKIGEFNQALAELDGNDDINEKCRQTIIDKTADKNVFKDSRQSKIFLRSNETT